jgi:dolichol kinase
VSGGGRQRPLRNAIHLATGGAAVWVLLIGDPWRWTGIAAMAATAGVVDVVRWSGGRGLIDRLLPGVYRDPEPLGISGATLLGAGYLLTVVLFSPQAAAGGILALAVGDPAAAIVGRWYGGRVGGASSTATRAVGTTRAAGTAAATGKTWAGSLACFAAVMPVIWLVPGFDLPAAAAAAAMAALVERRTGPLDNVLVPVAVAMLLDLWV